MKFRLTLILCSVLLLCAGATLAGDPSPSKVLADVAKLGPTNAIAKYFNTPEWPVILTKIGTANDEWLKVYVELKKGADGESSEDLSIALWYSALPIAPYKVFAIEHDFSCEFTFEPDCPPGGIDSYLNKLTQGLDQASTPAQHKMKRQCLAGIKKTRAAFPNPKAYCSQ